MVPAGLERNGAAPDVVSAEPEGRMLGWVVLAVLLALAMFPKSLGWMRVRLVDWTERALRNATPGRVLFWVAVLLAVLAFSQIFAADIAWLAAMDVATWVEASAALALAGAVVRVDLARRAVAVVLVRAGRAIRRGFMRARSTGRVRRVQTRRKAPPPEDWAPAWA